VKASVAPARSEHGGLSLDRILLPALAMFSTAMVVLNAPLASIVRELKLPDTDDAMRLVQVLDLLHGQDWFDKVQHRLGPPPGIAMHWSRIVDAPLALGILGLRPLVSERLAAGLVAAIWPALLLSAYLATLWLAASRWYGARVAWLAVLAATQMTTIGLFAPGRIDHHNLQILTMLWVTISLCDRAEGARGALMRGLAAGCLAAMSLAIGLETLPFVGLAGVAAMAAWVLGRDWAGPRLAGFGLALALTAPFLLAAETKPAEWLAAYCDALSLPWLTLACPGGIAALALSGLRLRSVRGRLAAAAAAGAIAIAPFLVFFRGCALSPLGDLPEIVRREWLGKVAEALPLPSALAYSPEMVAGGMLPLAIGAGYLLAQVRTAGRPGDRDRALFLAAFLAVGLVVSTLQLRGIYIASVALPIVAGLVLDRAVSRIGIGERPGRLVAALALGLLMLGKVTALPVLAFQHIAGRTPSIAISRHLSNCAEESSLARIAGAAPMTILAPIDLGTTILLYTPHSVVAAPYHRAASGIEAALRGFSGTEADLSREAQRTGAGILALCRRWVAGEPDSFAHALATGARASWLEPLITGDGDLVAWRVIPLRPAS
jgi:hypothetical protein